MKCIFRRGNNFHWLPFVFGILPFGMTAQSGQENLRMQVERIIRFDTDINLAEHHGFIIGIIDGVQHFILNFPGAGQDSLSENSLFQLGGLSQVLTAHYLVDLQQQRLINLDDPLSASGITLPNSWEKVTWRQCMQHGTGIPKLIPGLNENQSVENPFGSIEINHLLEALGPIRYRPGTFNYSPHNYALLQYALEKLLDQSFEVSFQAWCNHLGLVETGIDIESFPFALAPGFRRNGMTADPWSASAYQAALGVTSSLADLMTYVRWMLEHANDPAYRDLFLPSLPTHLRGRIEMAGGWYVLKPVRRTEIYSHSGQTGGHKAYIGFVPETKTAVVVLGQSPEETNELGLLILRMINDTWKRKGTNEKK